MKLINQFHPITVLFFVLLLCLLLPLPTHGRIRTEGNYTIDLTMQPDPVQDGQNATFSLKVTLDNGNDAGEDFSSLSLMVGEDTLQPSMTRDPDTGIFTGTYPINKPPGMQAGDTQAVTVYFWNKDTEGSTAPPGEWGVHNSEADPKQKRWRLKYRNPFYLDTSPPRDWSIPMLFAILGAMITALVFTTFRRRP